MAAAHPGSGRTARHAPAPAPPAFPACPDLPALLKELRRVQRTLGKAVRDMEPNDPGGLRWDALAEAKDHLRRAAACIREAAD